MDVFIIEPLQPAEIRTNFVALDPIGALIMGALEMLMAVIPALLGVVFTVPEKAEEKKREIFERLNRDLEGKISDIQFRIGEISGKETKPKTKKAEGKSS